jgi:CubicO group peptidase (beta-lactamase class C family)
MTFISRLPTRLAPVLLAALAIGLTATAVPGPAAAGPADDPRVAGRLALLELWIGDQMEALDQPGLSIGIVAGGELVWARGFGFADLATRRPAAPDTVYRIGSISKTFTATAAMQLRDAGRLRLDDPVAAHLPWLAYRDRFPDGPRITVWNLLTHTSGLPRDAAVPYWTDRRFPDREQLTTALRDQEILYEPGTHYLYSNLGLALAGEVVAVAAGRPYAEVVREGIFEPLGMTSTYVELPPAGRLATGYLARLPDGAWPPAPPTDAAAISPAANLSSTVEDLARYVAGQLEGGPLLSAPALREMHRVHWLADDWSSGRGLGFSVWRQGDRTLVGHAGWVAGHRGQVAFDPATGSGVVVLTNCDGGGPGDYVRQAFAVAVPALEAVTGGAETSEKPSAGTMQDAGRDEELGAATDRGVATAPGPPGAASRRAGDLARYTGAYHTPFGELSDFLVVDGGLAIYDHGHPPTRDPLGSLTELAADGEHRFRMTGDNGHGERVVFELRPDGRVARVQVAENFLYPADCGEVGPDLQCTWR